MDDAKKSKNVLSRLLATGCVLFLLLNGIFCWYAIIKPNLAMRAAHASTSNCLRNVSQMTKAILLYSQDWDDTLPPANRRQKVVQSRLGGNQEQVFRCRVGKTANSYGLNRRADGLSLLSIKTEPQMIVLFFETVSAVPNAVGGKENLPLDGRHAGIDVYKFIDGHVNQYSRSSPSIAW